MEYWVTVAECPFLEVSNMGNVRKKSVAHVVKDSHGGTMVRHDKAHTMAVTDNGSGYKIVSTKMDGKRKNYYVHRLVGMAFVQGYEEGMVIDHINHDKSDNRAENLAWVTQKENVSRSRHLMSKPKTKSRPTNTGEKYISFTHNRYTVFSSKPFKTLEEAIQYRDGVMG